MNMTNTPPADSGPEPHPGRSSSPRLQRGLWLTSAAALVLFLLLAAAVVANDEPYFAWDLAVSRAVQAIDAPGFAEVMAVVSWAGDDLRWSSLLVAAACLLLLALHRWREAAVLLGVVLVGQALKIAAKQLIGRPRPDPGLVQVVIEAHEIHSFPSGHTVHYTVVFGFLVFLTWFLVRPRVLRGLLLGVFGGLILLVGLSRIYLGAHWPSDILGGHLLGGAVLAAGIALYLRWSSPAAGPCNQSH
jgi:undecaprenyl-diphosphatase